MRLVPIIALALLASCGQTPTSENAVAAPSLREQIVGSWRSENLGLDYLIWMVDTYRADGTMTTDFYAKPAAEVIHHKDKTRSGSWRLVDQTLEVGSKNDAGEFEREGMPRPLHVGDDGILLTIDTWTRLEDGT